jgi:glycosyltransferase involved in cell wall biosynthesis
MKKILIFSTAYLPMIGGAEIAVKEITDRLGDDFSFNLICARIKKELPAQEKIGRIDVYRLGCGCFFDKYYLALAGHYFASQLHKQNSYNAIWAIMASYGGFAAMFFKKKNPSVPFLLTLQEGDPLDHIKKRVGIFAGWFAQIFTRSDYIQAISRFLAGWAKEMGAKCPIEVVPNGVNPGKFSIFPLRHGFVEASNFQFSNKEFKEKLGIKENEKVIITASRLVGKNGIGDLIGSLTYLSVNFRLLILGSGPLEKGLKSQVLNSKLQDRVLFFGKYENDDLPKYLAISDVFVRPSLSEGQGISFLEAMAAGVPIIGTNVGGIPDFLKDNETGLFCEVANPKSIAEKIEALLNNEDLRQRLIVNGKKLVEEKYDWLAIAQRMREIINRLIA